MAEIRHPCPGKFAAYLAHTCIKSALFVGVVHKYALFLPSTLGAVSEMVATVGGGSLARRSGRLWGRWWLGWKERLGQAGGV